MVRAHILGEIRIIVNFGYMAMGVWSSNYGLHFVFSLVVAN